MLKFIALLIAIISCIVLVFAAAAEDDILLRGTNDAPRTPDPNVHGTNDVTLFVRALYQDCDDSNGDYLAASFLQEPKKTIASNKFTRDAARNDLATVSQNNVVYFSVRTVYLDTLLQDAIENGFKQVVIIAAGYDSRAYRFGKENPGVQFFELDLPQVIKAKTEDVAALGLNTDNVEYVGVDLAITSVKEVLVNNDKFVQAERTLYFVEGLIYYLPQAAVDSLYSSLGEIAAPGSFLAYDFANKCLFEHSCEDLSDWEIATFLKVMDELKQEPWKSGMEPSEHKEWLADKGFDVSELIDFRDAKELLKIAAWKKSPVMSQLNFVTAVVSKPYDVQSYLHTSFLAMKDVGRSFTKALSNMFNVDNLGILIRGMIKEDENYFASSLIEPPVESTSGAVGSVRKKFSSKSADALCVASYSENSHALSYAQIVYFDTLLRHAMKNMGIKQVVIIGAEFDSKAYRFGESNPDVKFFEIDLPEVMEQKVEEVFSLGFYTEGVEHIGADLTKIPVNEVLRNNEKFVQAEPTLYLLNGLTYHLPQTDIDSMFKSLSDVAAPGSILAYDFVNRCLFDKSCRKESKKFKSFLKSTKDHDEPWINGMDPSSHNDWLAEKGFEMSELISMYDAGIKSRVKKTTEAAQLLSQMNFVTAIKKAEEITPRPLTLEDIENFLLEDAVLF